MDWSVHATKRGEEILAAHSDDLWEESERIAKRAEAGGVGPQYLAEPRLERGPLALGLAGLGPRGREGGVGLEVDADEVGLQPGPLVPQGDQRRTMDAVFWIAASKEPWKALPRLFISAQVMMLLGAQLSPFHGGDTGSNLLMEACASSFPPRHSVAKGCSDARPLIWGRSINS